MIRKQKYAKISLNILLFGWFPMLFMCAFGADWAWVIRLFIIFSTMAFCGISGLIVSMYIKDSTLWKTEKEIRVMKKQALKARFKYKQALHKFVVMQNVNENGKPL